MNEPFRKWEAKFDNATIALDVLSSNTFLMLVSSDPHVGEFPVVPASSGMEKR